ncbi:Increased rDNA silencing protein [Exserohilum turcicum]|uniref:EH domain-containing protein n=1 Tax=Exserohilum turcicum (strain 28A) TaxID=671987 RepID=R0J0J4_EXST2|nr:uncharacterized protein SETTUDRAFT_167190 [Exserohilum turcica Et28A]EOA90291.1 hypothetical protein SETTUDRAFT_167190 [Exserohilum turcica Et28A]
MSAARNHGQAPQPAGDAQSNTRSAALQGASRAFSKPAVKPKPATNTYTGRGNAALLAATRVGTGSPAPLRRDHTGDSASITRPNLSGTDSTASLSVPDEHANPVSSPSNIAARLAAARHSPLRPIPQPRLQPAPAIREQEPNEMDTLPPAGSVGSLLARLEPKRPGQQPQKRRDSLGSQSTASHAQRREPPNKPTDDTPIPPTNTLVKMFEQGQPMIPSRHSSPSPPLHVARSSPPPVRSPKPRRTFSLPPDPGDDVPLQRKKTQTPPPVKPKPKPQIQLPPRYADGSGNKAYFNTPKKDPMKSPAIKQKQVQLAASKPPKTPPPKPVELSGSPSAQRRRISTSMESSRPPSTPSSFKSAKEEQEGEEEEEEEKKLKPTVPPPRRSTSRKIEPAPPTQKLQPTTPIQIKPRADSQKPSSVSPMPNLSPHRPTSSARTASPSVYHNNYQRESVKQITQHMTGESLSSAIMGAALASHSRTVSPASRPISVEPLFPPRKQHHHHLPFHRSPSPQKNSPPRSTGKLRTTMRKEPSSSDDEDKADKYKKKGTRIMGIKGRKHPNKHHEGTRKRWRDQITDRERKRYEGVWAANKGLHIPSSLSAPLDDDPSADVLNIVVKEIWMRSRLPTLVLEEIWDLVDGRAIGRLTRYEFVVGLWLIDQRLKGRKLPVKVSDSVWRSARGVDIKVKIRH